MIKIQTVGSCPHTGTGKGVMRISHSVIGILAGAVEDSIEWLALLKGTRSDDGLDVTVTGLEIPEQNRSQGACSLVHNEPLAEDVVGVVHSHHSMGAFFSTTDDTTLNTRFPTSLVIAQLKAKASDTEVMLGFMYKAEGRAPLPCGSVGIIPFTVQPAPILVDWPEIVSPGYTKPDESMSLYWCPHKAMTPQGHMIQCETKCGIHTEQVKECIFGKDSEAFMKDVNKQTKHRGVINNPLNMNRYWDTYGYGRKGGRHNEEFLRHWGVYGQD